MELDPDEVRGLLDLSRELDVGLLDAVVGNLHSGAGDQRRSAQEVLTALRDLPEAWTKVDAVLEMSQYPETKYFALQILEGVIKTRWRILPPGQRDGIKRYVVGLVVKTSSAPEALEREKMYLGKLNVVLVQILKREWPARWESFVPDIVGASQTSASLCQNTMVILKLLSEEVFDFASGQMTRARAELLKGALRSQFSEVFRLCRRVLDGSRNPGLVGATLEAILGFLRWMPPASVFETGLANVLATRFLGAPLFRNVALKCLAEIAGLPTDRYDNVLVGTFSSVLGTLEVASPLDANVKEAYARGTTPEQQFIQNLALFLGSFLKRHGALVEKRTHLMSKSLSYLLLVSEVEDVEVFKVCLEYWNGLAEELYRETPLGAGSGGCPGVGGSRRETYKSVLSRVRSILISRMAKPEEVLVVENDQGEVVREFMQDTNAIALYKTMRETLVYLTHLDKEDTEKIMTEKLQNQVNGKEWSRKNLNTLCWAIGSISGSMQEEDEKEFLVTVIKDMLVLSDLKRGKDNKAIVASNVMYIVGQYPRFMCSHWKFLKTVVTKLLEFMHETHEGIQDMACDTFIKIAQNCQKQFMETQVEEVEPLINLLLANINSIVCDLQPQQVQTFYEAVGHIIASCNDSHQQSQLIERYMELPNKVWDDIINQATENIDILKDLEVAKKLRNVLKINARACKALGQPYVSQLAKIFLDMLNVYKFVSGTISTAIKNNGEAVTRKPVIKTMQAVRKETLKVIGCWVEKCQEPQVVLDSFIPHLLDPVFLDYQRCPAPSAREPEVLSLMATIVTKLNSILVPQIPEILDILFDCTLEMINKDFEEFPDHRIAFFTFLQSISQNCFTSFFKISHSKFKLVMDSIMWGFKHTLRSVADISLDILYQLLQSINSYPEAARGFYKDYYIDILQHLLSVVADTSHAGGLFMHATIMAYMFSLVKSNKVSIYLGPNAAPHNFSLISANKAFVQEYVENLLKKAFFHLTDSQIKTTVHGLFHYDDNIPKFKEYLRDFLVQIREYTGEDDSDLFREELERSQKKAQEDKRRYKMTVPGMLNPHEVSKEMQEDM